MPTLSDIVEWLSALSSLALILGSAFVVLQLRQNNRLLNLNTQLLESTVRQERSDVAIALLEHLTDQSFPRRRWRMHEIVRRFEASGWKGAFESEDDFEVRHFVQIYELIGSMARRNVVDLQIVLDSLQHQVVRDWEVFQPHLSMLAEKYGLQSDYFASFRWLANEGRNRLPSSATSLAAPRPATSGPS